MNTDVNMMRKFEVVNKYCRVSSLLVGACIVFGAFTAKAVTMLPGVKAEYFAFFPEPVLEMPDLDNRVPDVVKIVDAINQYPAVYGAWEGLGEVFGENFAARYTARLQVPQSGIYTFVLESDDGSILYLDGEAVIDNSDLHQMNCVSNRIELTAGYHDLKVDYFEKDGQAGVRLSWSGPGVDGVISGDSLQQDASSDPEGYAELYGIPVESIIGDADPEITDPEITGPTGTVSHGIAVLPGVKAEYFAFFPEPVLEMPDLDTRVPDVVKIVDAINQYPAVYGAWEGLGDVFGENFAARYTSRLQVPQSGMYTFVLESDDGSILYLDGEAVIDNSDLHQMNCVSNRIELTAGYHDLKVDYFEKDGQAGVRLSWSGPGVDGVISGDSLQQDVLSDPEGYAELYGIPVETIIGGGEPEVTEPTGTVIQTVATLPGILAEYFAFFPEPLPSMPSLEGRTPNVVSIVSEINNYPASNDDWDGLGDLFRDNFAVRYTAWLNVPADGVYTFFLESDDGSVLYLDEEEVIDNSDLHQMNRVSGQVTLTAGLHRLRVEFFDKDGQAGLRLSWEGPGVSGVIAPASFLQDVSSAAEFYAGLYGIPVESIAAGGGSSTNSSAVVFAGFAPGLQVEYYPFREHPLSALPDFSVLSPTRFCVRENIRYARREMYDVVQHDFAFTEFFAARHYGKIYVDRSGVYTFRTYSNDGVRLLIDGETVIDNDGLNDGSSATGSVTLAQGMHDIELLYFGYQTESVLELWWTRPGDDVQRIVSPSVLYHRDPLNFAPAIAIVKPTEGDVFSTEFPILLQASVADREDNVRNVSYYTGDGLFIGTSTNAPWSVTWNIGRAGTVSVYAVAVDKCGASRKTAPLSVSVKDAPRGCSSGLHAMFRVGDSLAGLGSAEAYLEACRADGCDRLDLADLRNVVVDVANSNVTMKASVLDYPSVESAWGVLPRFATEWFSAEFTGRLFVEKSDLYTFYLSSDDGCELWLDGEKVIDNYVPHAYETVSAQVLLKAGLHEIRIRYFEEEEFAGLNLSWSSSTFAQRTIGPHEFVYTVGNVDADGDGMDDWWEELFGLSPDDATDANLDPDGDGITNLEEFRHGTNPRSADSDNDGMPDAWEIARGTKPFYTDIGEDPDRDGLANIDEYRIGTDPNVSDTDGDGCPDGIEVWNVRSDPLTVDITWGASSDIGAPMSARYPVSTTGIWDVDEDGVIFAGMRAGSLTWRLAVPAGGADAFAVRVVQHDIYSPLSDFDFSLRVDGVLVASTSVSAPYGQPGDAVFFIPEISPGEHEFRLVWNNWDSNTFVGIIDLRFLNFGGPDTDGNGVADWRDVRDEQVAKLNPVVGSSYVSPVCIEGHGMWGDRLELDVDYGASNAVYSAIRTIGDGFYADIPLVKDEPTTVSVDDGRNGDSATIAWSELDLFDNDYTEDALVVRAGDSLLFGSGTGEVGYSVSRFEDGSWLEISNFTATASMAYMFADAGDYLVSAFRSSLFGEDEGCALVKVVSSRFPNRNPAVRLRERFTLECPAVDPENVLEHDADIMVSAERKGAGVSLDVYAPEDRDYGLVSRLDENGPISDAVQANPVWFDSGTYCRVLQTYSDGSQVVEVSLLLGTIPSDLTVELEIFVSGVTFEDGTNRKTLTAADFDDNGMYSLRFIKARGVTTSVCHRTYIRQTGVTVLGN